MKTKRVIGGLALLLIVGIAAFAIFALPSYRAQARIGVGFAARVACSCRYVGGRTLSDCHKDFEPGMEPVTLTDDPAKKAVTAHYPLLASATAHFEESWGCRLDPQH